MKRVQISVIIPNYNHGQYLGKRIDSVLAQTYQDFEVIILDDKSSDNSKEVIERYRSHHAISQIIYNEFNSGSTFNQWEKGINLAKGELIWIAESDDWCEPTLLETLVEGFTANVNCVLGYVQAYTVKDERDILRHSFHPHFKEHMNGEEFVRKYMIWACSIFNASMALFKKNAYYAVSKDYTSFKFCGDWLFWTEIARQGDVFISGKVLNFFRKHDKDVSGSAYASGLNFKEEIRVLTLLHDRNFMNTAIFKEALSIKYTLFHNKKKDFHETMIRDIETQIEGTGYKKHLIAKVKLSVIKGKLTQVFRKLRLIE